MIFIIENIYILKNKIKFLINVFIWEIFKVVIKLYLSKDLFRMYNIVEVTNYE